MEAIRQSYEVLESFIRDAAVFFVENTHVIGRFLKSSSVAERHPREANGYETYAHYRPFLKLSEPLKRVIHFFFLILICFLFTAEAIYECIRSGNSACCH